MARRPKGPSRTKKRPSFFKVMCGDFRNTLKLPLAFTQRFEAELKTKSVLKDPTGTWWYVKAKKIEDHLFFKNNWPRFVESNSLQYGDVLIFTYVGDSTFVVKIYDRTECEKDFASAKNGRSRESASAVGSAPNTSNQMGVCGKSGGKRCQDKDRRQSCHKEAGELSKHDENKSPSIEISRQCDTPAASERTDGTECLPTTKSRAVNVESSAFKRRKLSSEDQGRLDICSARSERTPGQSSLRKSKRLSNNRKAAEISKEKELYQGKVVGSDVEIIVVDSESESEETNRLEAAISFGKDIGVHCDASRVENIIEEEIESHCFEVADKFDSLILEESLPSPVVRRGSRPRLSAKGRRRAITHDKEKGGIEIAENLSYEVSLSQSYISKGFLHVPIMLRRSLSNIPAAGQRENVRLWISDDQSWSVRLSCGSNKAYFCGGWREFVVDNDLVEGDICTFQLMKTGKLDLRVSMHRVSEQLKSLPLPADEEPASSIFCADCSQET